ncbi:MAG: cation transporter [Armatimonadetes bacterium]|nr:cation transporter [Armatimonadota bacterium]
MAHAHGKQASVQTNYPHPEGHGGWLHGVFVHDHKHDHALNDSLASHERGIRALKISLIGLLLTATLQTGVVAISGSAALLADTIHNFVDAATSIPLWVAFALARRSASKRFTYGYGKAEDMAGVAIVLLIFSSACAAAYESIQKIIHPLPMTNIGWVAAAGIVGFVGNEAVAQLRMRVGREISSAALIADGQHSRIDGLTSLAVVVGAAGARLGYGIIDPLIGLVITISILVIAGETAKAVWGRLVDAIEPEIVAQIEELPLKVRGVQGVHDVRARWMGHKIVADLHITVHPFLTVQDSHAIAVQVRDFLREKITPLASAVVHVDPGDELAAHRLTRGEQCRGCLVCTGCQDGSGI